MQTSRFVVQQFGEKRFIRSLEIKVNLENLELNALSVDELWTLHEQVAAVLSEKILAEKRGLEERLAMLDRAIANKGKIAATGQNRRPRRYPPVLPKYQNPNDS